MAKLRAFVPCDGEAKQITVFQEQQHLQAFASTKINLGKPPASCSAVCQSSYVSDFFKATKRALKHVHTKFHMDDLLYQNIITCLDNCFTTERNKQIADGLCQIMTAIDETLTKHIVKRGYERCGQSPLDLRKAMSLCTTNMIEAELKTMEDALPDMINLFRTKGTITEDCFHERQFVQKCSKARTSSPSAESYPFDCA
jgi:hypothetical protein